MNSDWKIRCFQCGQYGDLKYNWIKPQCDEWKTFGIMDKDWWNNTSVHFNMDSNVNSQLEPTLNEENRINNRHGFSEYEEVQI